SPLTHTVVLSPVPTGQKTNPCSGSDFNIEKSLLGINNHSILFAGVISSAVTTSNQRPILNLCWYECLAALSKQRWLPSFPSIPLVSAIASKRCLLPFSMPCPCCKMPKLY